MRTSYKKNRPFDFKLIDHVEPKPLLYKRQTGLSNYDVMKAKTEIWAKIAEIMECDVEFCLMRWNNLHYQYRKESRRPSGSTWPYFERLKFLSSSDMLSRPKAKPKSRALVESEQSIQVPPLVTDEFVGQNEWQSYNDCVVIVNDMEQHVDSTFIIEEIIESTAATDKQTESSTAEDLLKIDQILEQLDEKQRQRAERRIMAFLLKCQLRGLMNEAIDDLAI
ncbi:CG9948 [Drosophila busckii]|uniref:CG9948 n=2 Tax=Drosophila busckii TaxID=30019 RepID=A0A0M3QW95_DROBS|nr:CG9948 [Drosophila busckii]